MRLRLTSKDFILLLGIMVAAIIAIATLWYRDSLVSIWPSMTKKSQAASHAAVLMKKSAEIFASKFSD